ncbi:MAG: hypothetical protein H2036_08815 [Acidimicrobiales bacterium]|nr:hypothetical protein [Acidimicrobiales bacterium]
MTDIQIDAYGEQRCWNCGGENFIARRSIKTWLLLGGFALLTKKKLLCLDCRKFNNVPTDKVL